MEGALGISARLVIRYTIVEGFHIINYVLFITPDTLKVIELT